jgi:hypothetical protein
LLGFQNKETLPRKKGKLFPNAIIWNTINYHPWWVELGCGGCVPTPYQVKLQLLLRLSWAVTKVKGHQAAFLVHLAEITIQGALINISKIEIFPLGFGERIDFCFFLYKLLVLYYKYNISVEKRLKTFNNCLRGILKRLNLSTFC